MKITANHVTVIRIICLPVPCWLIYGGTVERTIALIIFIILGLTDYLDGIMARREGGTPLGRLLDPIADKIFLTVTFVPLLHLNILPVWIVWPIFMREFLVTDLRKFMTGMESGLKVTDLSKLKTTLQMTGFGLILFNDTFPDKNVSIALLLAAVTANSVAWLVLHIKKQPVDNRIRKALIWTTIGLVIIVPCSADTTNIIYGIILTTITLVSGWQYIKTGLPLCIKQGIAATANLASSLFIPLTALALTGPAQPYSVLVIIILSLEFAVQGLDMWAVQEGYSDISVWKRRLLAPLTTIPLIYWVITKNGDSGLFIQTACVMSMSYAMLDFWLRRRLIISGMFPWT